MIGVCLSVLPLTAANWPGTLVDADCYTRLERNVSPRDTLTNVDRDRDWEIRYCHPTEKTKLFGLVDRNGQFARIEASDSGKLRQFTRRGANLHVTIVGTASTDRAGVKTIKADDVVGFQ
jgi:hypothetical protein